MMPILPITQTKWLIIFYVHDSDTNNLHLILIPIPRSQMWYESRLKREAEKHGLKSWIQYWYWIMVFSITIVHIGRNIGNIGPEVSYVTFPPTLHLPCLISNLEGW